MLCALAGCASDRGPEIDDGATVRPSSDVPAGKVPDVISLQSAPTAVNWDGKAGADGLVIRMYCFRRDQAKAFALAGGTVEFALYEGVTNPTENKEAKRAQRWVFTADQMLPMSGRSAFGEGYALQLPFEGEAPDSRSVTLVATYYVGIDPKVRSKPVVIAMP